MYVIHVCIIHLITFVKTLDQFVGNLVYPQKKLKVNNYLLDNEN